jgi:hypothetical protein
LSAGSFVALFFGGMISSSDNHGGRQCCSRPEAFEHWLLLKQNQTQRVAETGHRTQAKQVN